MGIKEDVTALKAAFDDAMAEIQSDIEALKAAVEAGGNTPPEVIAMFDEMKAKLQAVRDIYNPVTPPPDGEPL